MQAIKMHVMLDIKDYFKSLGMGHAEIADIMHKDKTVVDKQLSAQNGTQTLLTSYGYAEAAGGRVIFVRDEDWERLKQMEHEHAELLEQLRDRDQRLGNMSETLKSMSAQIDSQSRTIQRLENRLDDREDSIKKKDATIERKDSMIADLLRKSGALG